jgi:replication factor A1
MQMDDFLISHLSIGACDDSLCVHASRFWDFFDPNDEAKLLHSDLVLIDEEV